MFPYAKKQFQGAQIEQVIDYLQIDITCVFKFLVVSQSHFTHPIDQTQELGQAFAIESRCTSFIYIAMLKRICIKKNFHSFVMASTLQGFSYLHLFRFKGL